MAAMGVSSQVPNSQCTSSTPDCSPSTHCPGSKLCAPSTAPTSNLCLCLHPYQHPGLHPRLCPFHNPCLHPYRTPACTLASAPSITPACTPISTPACTLASAPSTTPACTLASAPSTTPACTLVCRQGPAVAHPPAHLPELSSGSLELPEACMQKTLKVLSGCAASVT